MFGHPKSRVAEFFGLPSGFDGVLVGLGRGPVLGDRREVDDGEVHVRNRGLDGKTVW